MGRQEVALLRAGAGADRGDPDCSQRASPSPLPADSGSNGVFDFVMFLELFAGEGQLSCTLREAGLDVLPRRGSEGGTDFTKRDEIERLKSSLKGVLHAKL